MYSEVYKHVGGNRTDNTHGRCCVNAPFGFYASRILKRWPFVDFIGQLGYPWIYFH